MFIGNFGPEALRIRRLVPLVAHVDAFGVVNVGNLVIALGQGEVAVLGAVGRIEAICREIRTHVLAGAGVGGCRREVVRVGVRRAPGGIYLPPENLRQNLGAVLARIAHEQHGIDARRGIEGTQGHGIRRVHHHDDVLVRGAHIGEKCLLLGREVKRGPARVRFHGAVLLGHLVLRERHVVALACVALQDHDGGVRERLRVPQKLVRIARAVRYRGLVEHT